MSREMKRRDFLRLIGIGTGAAVLAACGPTPTAAPATIAATEVAKEAPTVAPPAEKVTFRYAFWGTDDPQGFQGRLASAFMQKYPNYEIKLEPAPWSGYHEKLLTSLAGGVGADLVACSDQYFSSFVRKGIFRPIDDLIERDGVDLSKFIVDQRLQVGYQGKIYGFGNFVSDSPSIYANKKLTDEAGVQLPEFGTDSFWTWNYDDLVQAAKACTKRDSSGRCCHALPDYRLANSGDVVYLTVH
ncbi:MAG: ABC transporter substrate-binding protein [Anaerolineae bacterium]